MVRPYRNPFAQCAGSLLIGFCLVESGPAQPTATRPDRVEAWLYVEVDQIRQELLLPARFLPAFLPITAGEDGLFDLREQAAATRQLEDFLAIHNPLSINSRLLEADSVSVAYFDQAITTITAMPPPQELAWDRALVGVILVYTPTAPTRSLSLQWTLFSPVVTQAQATVYAGASASSAWLTPNDPVLVWAGQGVEPLPAPSSLGVNLPVAKPSEDQLQTAFSELLRQAYLCLSYRREEDTYDALARLASGTVLTELYLAMRGATEIEEAGGARARITEIGNVRLSDTDLSKRSATIHWEVTGRVEHWGHVHTRVNAYAAIIAWQEPPSDGALLLTRFAITRHERMRADLTLREAPPVPAL